MKIIQSYWSKPMRINDNTEAVYRSNGGWCKKIYFYASWALSCLRLAKMYDDVELYTDSYGKHILYEMLELPYTNVSTDLECLDSLNHNLWAFGKIYTYSLQSQPFLHVDSDVYMWKKFDDRIMSADVVGQSLEENYVANIDYFNRIEKVLTYIPDAIRNARKTSPNDVIQLNAGILGGNDMAFFREYTREAFMMVDKNYDSLLKLNNISKGEFNMVFEQFLAYCLCCENKVNLQVILKGEYRLSDFCNIPNYETYIHAIGTLKKFTNIGDYVLERLIFEFPEYYDRILNLINKNMI
jgi:hypothetical protein